MSPALWMNAVQRFSKLSVTAWNSFLTTVGSARSPYRMPLLGGILHYVRTFEWPRLDSVPVTWHCSARSGQGAASCKYKVNKKIIIIFSALCMACTTKIGGVAGSDLDTF